ncbi:MAG: glycosyltransferase [Desulfobacterales bacterium]|nr:glycosyltransferase [Desulfobacterales bacterium]
MNSSNKKKVAVLHILSSADIAGGERYLLDLIKYADETIKHLIILPYPGPLTQALEDHKYYYTIVNMKKKFSIRSILALVQYLKKNNVDIIHTHGYRANFYGGIASILGGTKIISTIHVSLYDYVDTPLLVRCVYILLERIFSHKTSTLICISNAMKGDMIKLGIDPRKIVVIPNGVDLERFYPRPAEERIKSQLGFNKQDMLIGTVGRMVTEKGQIYLLEALKYLKAEWKNLKCLFVGKGPMLPQLKKLARDSGLEDMCIFPGIRNDIELIYPMLELFVLPSIREPFGLVLLEAMASGVPVLATASGGPLDFINTGINGVLVPPKDSKALAQNISNLLRNKNRAEAIAVEGKKTVENEFSVKETVKKIQEVYFSL